MIDALAGASSPLLRELRIVGVTLSSRRGTLAGRLCLALGISYLFVPIDIIPDRLPYVGHLDEVGAVLLGLLGARLFSPVSDAKRRALSAASRAGVAVFARALTRPVLRLMLGRWPDRQEAARFRLGLRENSAALPPLLRAIAHVPQARLLVNRTMLLAATAPDASTSDPGVVASDRAPMMGDPMRIWRGPDLGFLHLEKTAGSSLTTFLAGQFHPLQIDPEPNRVIAPDAPELGTRGGHHPDASRALVWGHYDLATLEALGGERFLLTVLREPRARILSLYHYFRANCGDEARRVRVAHDLPLIDYLRACEPDVVNMVDNLYVRRLTGLYLRPDGHDPLEADPDGALRAAIAALDRLDFVGLAEDIDATLALLGARLGFAPPARAPQVNRLAANEANPFLPFRTVAREAVTAEAEAELDRLTRLDRVLYARGRARFARLAAA